MYNVCNNGTGDGMINEKDTGALINQIREVTRDHIDWIKTQLLKPNNFMVAKGREVWIDVPNSKLKNIVTIPSKDEPNYRESWARVYNLAVDYLEGCLSYACMTGNLDYRTINWPGFNSENANYARGLEKIWDNYKLELARKLQEEEERKKLKVTKRSVVLSPVNTNVETVYHNEVKDQDSLLEVPRHVPAQDVLKSVLVSSEPSVQSEQIDTKPLNLEVNETTLEKTYEKEVSEGLARPVKEFVAQKILDGDKLNKKDVRDLHDKGASLVILPCQNVDNIKEEKMFFENMNVCGDENLKTGVMIYGKATDEKEAAYELKKLFKLLDQCGSSFTKCVIYQVNDEFVLKNKDSEMKLLSFINAYTMIAEGLARENFVPLLSMNLTSKKILEDIYKRYNLDSKYEVIYMVLVRELDELSKDDSIILMDPQYDYDMVTIRNPKFNNGEVLMEIVNSQNVKNTTLAKAA